MNIKDELIALLDKELGASFNYLTNAMLSAKDIKDEARRRELSIMAARVNEIRLEIQALRNPQRG